MAYQTGVFNSPKDLLQKFCAFATGLGEGIKWTKDLGADDGVGGVGWRLHLHKGGVYIHMRASLTGEDGSAYFDSTGYGSANSAILIYGGEGFSSAVSWKNQPNSVVGIGVPNIVGAGCPLNAGAGTAYHFFADANGDNLVCVVERIPGVFGNFGFGVSVDKTGAGSWTGGGYFFASVAGYYISFRLLDSGIGYNLSAASPFSQYSQANAFVRADVDSFTGKWLDSGDTNINAWNYGFTGKAFNCCAVSNAEPLQAAPSYSYLQKRLTCSMNGQSLMLPLRFTVPRDAGGHSFLGQLSNIFYCNATDHAFTPGALYTWGARQFRIFPNFAVEQV